MGHQIAGFYSPGLFSRSTAGEVAVEQSGAGRGAEWSRSVQISIKNARAMLWVNFFC